MKKSLKLKKIKSDAKLPQRATTGSAGMDLFACIDKDITIKPKELITIPTGIAISLEDNTFVGLLFARSSLATKHGITLSNGVGVIDSDYRGEIKVGLCNFSDNPYIIKRNDRIAQLLIMSVFPVEIEEVEDLGNTIRGKGGFGSTGKQKYPQQYKTKNKFILLKICIFQEKIKYVIFLVEIFT